MSVFAFPIRPAPLATATLATAADRNLDSIPAATARAGRDDTLARLIDVATAPAPSPTWHRGLRRGDGPLEHRGGRHLEPAPVRAHLLHRLGAAPRTPGHRSGRRLTRRKTARRGDRAIPRAGWTNRSTMTRTHCASECVADAARDRRPRPRDPLAERRGPGPGVPANPGGLQGRRDRTRALGHRHRPPAAPPAQGPRRRAGGLGRPPRPRPRAPRPRGRRHMPSHRPQPPVPPARARRPPTAPLPNHRPSPATGTWPAWAPTSASARPSPPALPPITIPPLPAAPADHRSTVARLRLAERS